MPLAVRQRKQPFRMGKFKRDFLPIGSNKFNDSYFCRHDYKSVKGLKSVGVTMESLSEYPGR